jgi:hypothetical protein
LAVCDEILSRYFIINSRIFSRDIFIIVGAGITGAGITRKRHKEHQYYGVTNEKLC